MRLTSEQLAKLRALARMAHGLESQHESARAAITGQRDYVSTLKRQLEQLPKIRDAAFANSPRSQASDQSILDRHDTETRHLKSEIAAADVEMAELREQLARITTFSSPLRDLIERVLRFANLDRAAAGINFDTEDRSPSERIELNTDAQRSAKTAPPAMATASPNTPQRGG